MQRRGLCYRSVHGYVQTRDLICFVCYSFSFSDLRKPRCVLIRVWLSDCDGCQLALLPLKTVMKMFQPTLLSLSESVDSLSANCNTCPLLLPHSHFEHHFYLLFHPLPPHLVPSNPLAPFLFALNLCCVLAQVGVSVEIYLISIFTFEVRFTEPVWQSPGVVQAAESTMPPLSWLCVSRAHWEWMALLRIEKRPSV